MTITIDAQLVSLLFVGFIAGTAAALLFEGKQSHSMSLRNGVIGIVGAFLGKLIFDQLKIEDDIPAVLQGTITVADILIAIVGAAILMLIARTLRR
jgi:uncharacterized membrane protein YeaQ/YmgE (transglycosylase-associated protein family)